MNILISGASGLVGSALTPFLREQGHTVIPLQRVSPPPKKPSSTSPAPHASWNPDQGWIDLDQAGSLDAVIHLAGHNINCRWTKANKNRIRQSRVQGTTLLSEALTRLPHPPQTLISASAIGYYGDAGSGTLDETSPAGQGFLPEVSQAWEAAADQARHHGIRVAHPRIGIVLTPLGGALAEMLKVFRLGLGGRLGHGQQFWSWITLEDLLHVFSFILSDSSLDGPVNTVAPHPVTNAEFTTLLGKALNRPTLLPVPGFMARLALGQMAQDAMLASARVMPAKLTRMNFPFRHPRLGPALQHLLA